MKAEDPHLYEHLLQAISKGNQRAFSAFYDLFSPELTKHILSKVSDIQIAEDILHDLFMSLWKNRTQITEIKSIPAYLYSSCRYLILAHYRQRIQRGNPFDVQDIDILDETVPIEERMHYRYVIDMVENEIENLPDKCQQIFKLSRHDYLSNKEIAQKLNISESTVEKHINKAIKRLRVASKNFVILF